MIFRGLATGLRRCNPSRGRAGVCRARSWRFALISGKCATNGSKTGSGYVQDGSPDRTSVTSWIPSGVATPRRLSSNRQRRITAPSRWRSLQFDTERVVRVEPAAAVGPLIAFGEASADLALRPEVEQLLVF